MTEEEMRKLTNMILDGLTDRQNELDEEFFKQCSDKSFNIVNFESTIEDKSQREIYLEK